MIRKLVRQMLAAQVLSALTVSLCLLIDNIMIGRFLGVNAIAAYGLANPVLLIIGAIGSMLSAGIQVVCSRSLGKGSQEETNRGYSSAIAVATTISIVFMLLVLLFRKPFATLLGAGNEGTLFTETSDYMAGFVIGAPGSMGALILVPFLQMAGKSTLLIVAVAGMTVADIVFDLLNVLVFNGGMFGMGLASSLSYYVAMMIGGGYFLSKKCVFSFSLKKVDRQTIRELFAGGVPTIFTMASTVILTFVLNKLLLGIGADQGSVAVAACSVTTTILNACCCIGTGIGGVSLTMAGILYNEEDRTGLRELLRVMTFFSAVLGAVVSALMLVFAPTFVSLFISEYGMSKSLAVFGIRLLSAGMIPCCLNNMLKNMYQGIGRPLVTEIISLAEGAVLPILVALVCSACIGIRGVWFYFMGGELLTLIAIILTVLVRGRKAGTSPAESMLCLPAGFGVPGEDLMEADIISIRDVETASKAASDFCRKHGQNALISNRIALCIEEMGGNTVSHGFSKDTKDHHLNIRVQNKNGNWVLRFRDDCRAFDPVHYVPTEEKAECTGIRMILKMADEIRYTYSMNLNNLTIMLKGQQNAGQSDG